MESKLPTEESKLPTEESKLPTEESKLPTEESKLPTVDEYECFLNFVPTFCVYKTTPKA
jgi:hypothetical protein